MSEDRKFQKRRKKKEGRKGGRKKERNKEGKKEERKSFQLIKSSTPFLGLLTSNSCVPSFVQNSLLSGEESHYRTYRKKTEPHFFFEPYFNSHGQFYLLLKSFTHGIYTPSKFPKTRIPTWRQLLLIALVLKIFMCLALNMYLILKRGEKVLPFLFLWIERLLCLLKPE